MKKWLARKFDALVQSALERLGVLDRVSRQESMLERDVVPRIDDMQRRQAKALEEGLEGIQKLIDDLKLRLSDMKAQQDREFEAGLASLRSRLAGLEAQESELRKSKVEIVSDITGVRKRLEGALAWLACVRKGLESDITAWLTNLQRQADETSRMAKRCYDDRYGDLGISYLDFENHFRGDEKAIAARFELYLQHFERHGCRKLLDVACGRGEMTGLLQDRGYDVTGVDLSPEMVGHCRGKGLPVVLADAFAYLEQCPDDFWDGIFVGQLVEHLGGRGFICLVRLCQRKLRKGGVMILETLNPQNLAIFQSAYYIDMTHVCPVNPLVVDWLLRSDGWAESCGVETACPDIDYAWLGVK